MNNELNQGIPLTPETPTPEPPSTPDSSPTVIEMAKRNAPNQGATPTPDTSPRIPKTQEQLKEALRQRAQILFKSIEGKLDELAKRDKAGEFKDNPDEPQGSGEARLKQAQDEILGNMERLKQMKALLDNGADLPQEELVPQDIDDFFTPALSVIGTPKNGFVGTYVDPRTQDYTIPKEPTKFGEYTLNKDTQNIDFEHIPESKIHIIALPLYVGMPRSEVLQYIAKTYPNFKLPGLEYWKWLKENPTKTPNKLKDTKLWFCFPGSLVRASDGALCVFSAAWQGSGWDHSVRWLGRSWNSSYRVVLLEI